MIGCGEWRASVKIRRVAVSERVLFPAGFQLRPFSFQRAVLALSAHQIGESQPKSARC